MTAQEPALDTAAIEALAAEIRVLRQELRELKDRQAIRDCLNRYCRGIDRMDAALVVSAYHPDAIDDHCFLVDGPAPLAAWANAVHARSASSHQHIITTHNCELDGDVAHAETYWMTATMPIDGSPQAVMGGGRYLDRFEKRDGEWKIAVRRVLFDWSGGRKYPDDARAALEAHGRGSRDRTDPSYSRPLEVAPGRIGYRVHLF